MPTEIPKPAEFIKQDQIDQDLDRYEAETAGLSGWKRMEEPSYLHMSLEELRKKQPQELAEAELELHRYALSVDRLLGRERAWEKWAKSKINQISAENLENIPSNYGFNERMHMARHKVSDCVKINTFLRTVEMRLSRLESVPENIRNVASCIKGIRFAAINRERQYATE